MDEISLPLTQEPDESEDDKTHKCFVMTNGKWNFHKKCTISNNKLHLMSEYDNDNPTKDLWIGDSGASCHFINTDKGMFNFKHIYDKIGVGNGNVAIASKEGSVKLKVYQKNGETCNITLHNVKYIKNLKTNLFSIDQRLEIKQQRCFHCY
jgi:hypothetical protein